MDRTRYAGAARSGQRDGPGERLTARGPPLLLLLGVLGGGCRLGPDLDRIVALEILLPDSGRITVGDTLHPRGRALDARGDSVAVPLYWSALDTAIIAVLDSATGSTVGKAEGTGRLQARAGALRSNPQPVTVLAAPVP